MSLNNHFNEEFGAMLSQVAASAQEIHRTTISEQKNVEIINSNLNEASLELKELSQDATDNADMAKEIYYDIDNKLDGVQESASLAAALSEKAGHQQDICQKTNNAINTVINSLEFIEDDIMGPLWLISINIATIAARTNNGELKVLANEMKKLHGQSKEKTDQMKSSLSANIEQVKRLSVTNEEFVKAFLILSKQIEKTFGVVQEIRVGSEGTTNMIEDFKVRLGRTTAHLKTVVDHVSEFAGSVKQTADAVGEIEGALINAKDAYYHQGDYKEAV